MTLNTEFRVRPPRINELTAIQYGATFRSLGYAAVNSAVETGTEPTVDIPTPHTPEIGPEAGPSPEIR